MIDKRIEALRKIWFIIWVLVYGGAFLHIIIPAFNSGILDAIISVVIGSLVFVLIGYVGAICMSGICALLCYPILSLLCKEEKGVWLWVSSIISIVVFFFLLILMCKCDCVEYNNYDYYDDYPIEERFGRMGH